MTAGSSDDPVAPALVVDDDTVSRLVLAHMLRGLGLTVVEADDLAPAVALVAEQHFSVVFSDYSMPGGTGLQLFQQLRSIPHRPHFVLVTGIVDKADHGSADPDGVDAYLAKPVSTRALRTCLSSLASQEPGPS